MRVPDPYRGEWFGIVQSEENIQAMGDYVVYPLIPRQAQLYLCKVLKSIGHVCAKRLIWYTYTQLSALVVISLYILVFISLPIECFLSRLTWTFPKKYYILSYLLCTLKPPKTSFVCNTLLSKPDDCRHVSSCACLIFANPANHPPKKPSVPSNVFSWWCFVNFLLFFMHCSGFSSTDACLS